MSTVFVGVPTYDSKLRFETASSIFARGTKMHDTCVVHHGSSLLAMNFNTLWCSALNRRKPMSIKWFVMIHGDVLPCDYWIDKLIEEAEEYDADVLSAVVPIKNNDGITSTAIGDPAERWRPLARLSTAQIGNSEMPETFDAISCANALRRMPEDLRMDVPEGAPLLVNTGCMAVRIDRPWAEQVRFNIADQIICDDGFWRCQVDPEDWDFSRQVSAYGGRVMATKAVRVQHAGDYLFDSAAVWGTGRDPFDRTAQIDREQEAAHNVAT